MLKLTKRAVDALAPKVARYRQAFGGGLSVRVEPSGVKTFILEYRPGAGGRNAPKQTLTLGRYGPMTAAEAQKAALDVLARVRQGGDPAREKRAERRALTVETLADQFLVDHVSKRKPATREAYAVALAKLKAEHGSLKAEQLTRSHVSALHHGLKETPYAANKLLAVVSKLYAWGVDRGLIPDGYPNPARRITRYEESARERFLSGAELARVGDALREGETVGLPYAIDETKPTAKHAPKVEHRLVKVDPFAVASIRLLALTGGRLREILDAKWSEIDIERGILFLSDSKTGKKPVYLSAAALTVLAGLPRLVGNPYVIPGAKEGASRVDLHKPWAAVTRAAGLDGLRIHDLRHSFASVGAGRSLGLPILGRLLGHSQPTTTQRYAHLADDPVRSAANTIAAEIDEAMSGKHGKRNKLGESATVTRLRK
jgi:integrase